MCFGDFSRDVTSRGVDDLRGAMVPWRDSGRSDHKRHVDASACAVEVACPLLPEWEAKKSRPGCGAEPHGVAVCVVGKPSPRLLAALKFRSGKTRESYRGV
jgi:hypothetical protein